MSRRRPARLPVPVPARHQTSVPHPQTPASSWGPPPGRRGHAKSSMFMGCRNLTVAPGEEPGEVEYTQRNAQPHFYQGLRLEARGGRRTETDRDGPVLVRPKWTNRSFTRERKGVGVVTRGVDSKGCLPPVPRMLLPRVPSREKTPHSSTVRE